ncbi:hypothetical protein [Corynebacterium accolens]|nr:hypothetical protein [Corynebacterium accolens]
MTTIKHRKDYRELSETPTQARHPGRAMVRTAIAAALALLPALPEITNALGISAIPAVASVLAIAAAITRVLAIPAVDKWLDRYLPGLSADMGYIENKDIDYDTTE